MRILRYRSPSGPAYGILDSDGQTVRAMQGSPFDKPTAGAAVGKVDALTLLPPVVAPKCICVGLNYKKHIEETNAKTPEFPMLFMKPVNTALVGSGADVVYPKISTHVDYEAELVIVIGKRGRWIARDQVK